METLQYYIKENKIPNIIFHGPMGCGKKTLVHKFMSMIYPDKNILDEHVMYVNCAFGKGIKFIREEIKFFSKMNTHHIFKSVVLLNCEKLTSDAQYALRRCIEQFNHNTRFFMVTTDKFKLLKPILSRFSELYVSSNRNYYTLQIQHAFPFESIHQKPFHEYMEILTLDNILSIGEQLYQDGYSALDLENYVEQLERCTESKKYTWLIQSVKVRNECRNESLLLYLLLHLFVENEI